MKPHPVRARACAAAALGLIVAFAARGASQSNQPAERFTAFAVSTGGVRSNPVADTVQITITRWSSEADRQRLVDTLQSKGPNALLEALRDAREVGTIRTPDSLGYPLRYAQQTKTDDGGRRIVIATDRPISFWEQVNRPRSIDYPFTLIQMEMKPDSTGEGRMSFATRIIAHDNVIELEDYDSQPIMLNQIRAEKR